MVREACSNRGELGRGLLLWLSLALTAWLYWPGIEGALMLDDGVNLRVLESLDETSTYLGDVVTGNFSGPLGRPLSMLSFGLERLWLDSGVAGFKRTNILLHLLTACLVAWLATRVVPLFANGCSPATAALLAVPWMLSPMFVSTTLYVVQRMAQLSTLFCLLGLLCYCAGRQRIQRGARGGWLLCTAVLPVATLALLSKENGIVLIPLAVLLEAAAWKWCVPGRAADQFRLRAVHAAVVTSGLAVGTALLVTSWETVTGGYAERDFTLVERLLTQARALCDYTLRLVLPLRSGLGIYHDDFVISRGLLNPVTTLPAVVAVSVASVFAVVRVLRGKCLVSYGWLFFIVAHTVESTILPLELYFEHRNYLGGVGIFMAVAGIAAQALHRVHWLQPPLRLLVVGWLGWAAIATGLQAAIWSNELALLLDAGHSHPKSVRVKVNLASRFARLKQVPAMLRFADEAAALDDPDHPRHALFKLALYCIADVEPPAGLAESAVAGVGEHELQDARFSELLQVLVVRVNRGYCPRFPAAALAHAFREELLAGRGAPASPRLLGLLAMLEVYLGEEVAAQGYLERWLERDPDAVQAWLMLLHVATASAQPELRERALRELERLDRAGKLGPENRDDILLYR